MLNKLQFTNSQKKCFYTAVLQFSCAVLWPFQSFFQQFLLQKVLLKFSSTEKLHDVVQKYFLTKNLRGECTVK